MKNTGSLRKTPNIFRKMFLSFILIPVIPLIALSILAYNSKKESTALAESNIIDAADRIGANIDQWVEKNVFVSNLAAQLDDITSMDPERQKPILMNIKENSDSITVARVDNAEGLAVARSDNKSLKDYSDRAYFKQVLSGESIGQQVIMGRTQKKPILCFTVPIESAETFLGALNQCASLDDISNNVIDLKIGNTGFAFLVDKDNRLVATGDKDSNLLGKLEDMSAHPAIVNGASNSLFNYIQGEDKIAYKKTVGLGWTLVIQQDYEEAFASPIATLQNAVITIVVTIIACIIFIYFLSLSISKPLQEARRETDNILEAVSDGLFLIDDEMVVGSQQSANLPNILQKDNLAGTSFTRYLVEAVPVDVAALAKDYVELLFNPKIKEELVQTRNPLKLVRTSVENEKGALNTRYLSITFRRIYEDGNITSLLVTAKDVTAEVLLQHELERVKEEKSNQITLLSEILHIPADKLRKFLKETDVSLNNINDILERPVESNAEYESKVKSIFRLIHKVKGDAALIKFDLFTNECHKFEDMLNNIQGDSSESGGAVFLPVTVALEDLFKSCHVVQVLLDKIGALSVGSLPAEEGGAEVKAIDSLASEKSEWAQLDEMAKRIAIKYDKEVEVHLQGFNLQLPERLKDSFKTIASQLIRNSVSHGIENVKQREKSSKVREGQILITLKHTDEGYVLVYKDDGTGVSYDRIREHLMESGKDSSADVKDMDNKDLLQVIFRDGFSSADNVTVDAGRGVGLPLITEKVKELDGKLKVINREGVGFGVKVTIPENKIKNAIAVNS